MVTHVVFLTSGLLSYNKENYKWWLRFAFAFLFLFSALRYGFGNDYFSYYYQYQKIQNGGKSSFDGEIGFEWLMQNMPSFQILIAIVSALSLFALYKLIVHNTTVGYCGIAVTILLINPYLFLMSLSAIRQTIAMTFFIGATYFSFKRKLVPYVLTIFLATLFHSSAIILLPFYFIANDKKIGKLFLIVYIAIFCVLLLNSATLNMLVEAVLTKLDNKQYSYYFDEGLTNSLRATILSAGFLMYVLLNLPFLQGKAIMYAKLYLVGITCGVLAYRLSMLTRIQQYFDIFSIVAIPSIMKNNRDNPSQNPLLFAVNGYLFPALMFIIYGLRYYSFFTNPMWERFFTYSTFLGA